MEHKYVASNTEISIVILNSLQKIFQTLCEYVYKTVIVSEQ